MIINGTFDVTLSPLASTLTDNAGVVIKRMAIAKTFHGELAAQSQGEMLSAMAATPGSAGYVALEQVSGTLAGKQGSFVLMHYGVMADGHNRLQLEVVPGSGSDELAGLSGSMGITIKEGQHFYTFDYQLG